jgi:hypothetical protein
MLRVYPIMEHLEGIYLGRLLVLFANIEFGYKGLPGTYTLAYYENS